MKISTLILLLVAFVCTNCERQSKIKMPVETIDSLDDEELLYEVFINIAERHTWQNRMKVISKLTKEQQVFYALMEVDMEVKNGGFNQYYHNNGDEFADLAVEGFKMIGANKVSDLVSTANRVYRQQREKIEKNQDGSLKGVSESYNDNPLNKLDHEFYLLSKEESMTSLAVAFVRKNKIEFTE